MIYVPGYGSSTAKLVAVGEAPGAHEELQGKPFVGPAGEILSDTLRAAGIDREAIYITNVVKVRPPNNDLKALGLLGKSIEDFLPQLWQEIEAIKPNVILALGNTALKALTGRTGIEKWRGSLLQTLHGYPKVVGTLHPASILHAEADGRMRSWKDLVPIQWDVQRAAREAEFRELCLPIRNLRIAKNSLDVYRFFEANKQCNKVAVDIETFRTVPICIGFAFNSYEAISIPLLNVLGFKNPSGISRSEMCSIWEMVAALLYDPKVRKIGQNFKFDEGQLERCIDLTFDTGLKVHGLWFDTMLAFKVLYPELPASLQFITSVMTDEPYYKDEGKEFNPHKDDLSRLLLYNAKDAVVTYEVYEREMEELEQRGLTDFFFTKQMPLHQFYYDMERRGIRQDMEIKKQLEKKYGDRQKSLEKQLEDAVGKSVNCMSQKQVSALLFGDLNLPPRKGTDEKTLDALARNATKDPAKRAVIENILETRKVRKTLGTYIKADAHPDGRLRTGVRIILETGRTSTTSLKPPVTTKPRGIALQTLTKHSEVGADIRSMYVPDIGYVFLEPDLSQAEARVVASLARDRRLLRCFDLGVDIHRVTAGWIDGSSPDGLLSKFYESDDRSTLELIARELNTWYKKNISDYSRQLGKKFRHAGHYDMGKREASVQAGVSEWRAGEILKKFHNTNPNIRGVFHAEIIQALESNNRILTNPFGRQRQFYNRWGDELFKEAYANIPQGTVSDHLKFAMVRIERRFPALQILEESHDSFLAQVRLELVDKALPIIKEELEVPIDMSKCSLPREELVIPCEIKLGKKNWQEMERVL